MTGPIEKRLLEEAKTVFKYGWTTNITEKTLRALIEEVRSNAKKEVEDHYRVKWHLVKDEMPRDGKPVWFYPPLMAFRSGRWNSYNSAMSKLAGEPESERDEDHWSPEFGNDFLGRKDDLIAWAYMDDDYVPSPKLKMEMENDV